MTVIRHITPRLLIAAALIMPGAGLHAQPAASAPPAAQPAAGAPATAQPAGSGPPNALQGFSQNRDQPVHIESATLEVRDKDKVATFSGKVHVTQGDTVMTCKALHVFYEQRRRARRQEQTRTGGRTRRKVVSHRRPDRASKASKRWKRTARWW